MGKGEKPYLKVSLVFFHKLSQELNIPLINSHALQNDPLLQSNVPSGVREDSGFGEGFHERTGRWANGPMGIHIFNNYIN